MPTYIVLGHFADQGIRAVRDSLKREDAFRKQCEKVGALVYSTGALGNIRTETLRAFSRRETEEAFELKAAYLGG